MCKEELKTCPFCGTQPRWCGDDSENKHNCHWITCDNCRVMFDVDSFEAKNTETMDELRAVVLKAWNTRATVNEVNYYPEDNLTGHQM